MVRLERAAMNQRNPFARDSNRGRGQQEVDYLVEDGGQVIPVEVKSGRRGRLTSMRLFLDKNRALSPFGIRFSLHPFSIVGDVQSWPLHAVAGLFPESAGPNDLRAGTPSE
jgi:hypothetical protein